VGVVIRLPRELRDALKQRAETEDRSLASLMRVAVRTYIND
jgi:predicted DNA-binding protein